MAFVYQLIQVLLTFCHWCLWYTCTARPEICRFLCL